MPGDYRKIRQIGKGSYGVVNLVRRVDGARGSSGAAGRALVMKVVRNARADDSKTHQEAKREVQVLSRLKHPNIVRFHEAFATRDGMYLCIVMDYCESGDLATVVATARKRGAAAAAAAAHGGAAAPDSQAALTAGLLPEEQILDWFVQLVLALDYLHSRRILHRDLKPQNVFLSRQHRLVKLGDFGITKTLEDTAAKALTTIGTPLYFSPEICDNKSYGLQSDIWSLGVLTYELLCLRVPFPAANLVQLRRLILYSKPAPPDRRYSREFCSLLAELLSKSPHRRPACAQILERDFVRRRLRTFAANCLDIAADRRRKSAEGAGGGGGGRGGAAAAAAAASAGRRAPPARGATPAERKQRAGAGGGGGGGGYKEGGLSDPPPMRAVGAAGAGAAAAAQSKWAVSRCEAKGGGGRESKAGGASSAAHGGGDDDDDDDDDDDGDDNCERLHGLQAGEVEVEAAEELAALAETAATKEVEWSAANQAAPSPNRENPFARQPSAGEVHAAPVAAAPRLPAHGRGGQRRPPPMSPQRRSELGDIGRQMIASPAAGQGQKRRTPRGGAAARGFGRDDYDDDDDFEDDSFEEDEDGEGGLEDAVTIEPSGPPRAAAERRQRQPADGGGRDMAEVLAENAALRNTVQRLRDTVAALTAENQRLAHAGGGADSDGEYEYEYD